MNSFKMLITMVLLLALVGCSKDAISTDSTSNSAIRVDTLFNKDGCTVYRFYDAKTVYFVKCDNNTSQVSYTEGCGKNCSRPTSINTSYYE